MPRVEAQVRCSEPVLARHTLPAGRGIDAGVLQDPPDRGQRHGDAEPSQLAVDAAVTPRLVLRASRSTTDRTFRCVAGRQDRPWRDRRDHRRRTMSRCHGKMVPGVTISRIAARRSIGTVPASRVSNARSGHVSRARAPGRSRPATASWWRSMRISASFHHVSRRDKPSSDTARETIRKISFKPTSRRSSHLRSGQDRPGACRTLQRGLQGLCPGGAGFRHPQDRLPGHA